jgi:cellulose synthase/poly-beta-1,6-N-acetylglucosamine synthase-like glycosyltransferase
MESRPLKVSVVVPAFNEESVISDTLNALLAQDYPDFEIIVVNNASTDKTAEVVSKFESKSKTIRLVHETKKGLLHARERGRKEAKGDIVANSDADCLPDKDWLSKATVYFGDKSKNVVAVSGPYNYYDAHPMFRVASQLLQNYVYRVFATGLQLPFIKSGAVLIGGNNLIRADVLNKMGGYNTSLVFYGEDTDTAKRVAKYGYIVFTPKVKMKTSARRFKDEGHLKMIAKYLYHFFKHTLRSVK